MKRRTVVYIVLLLLVILAGVVSYYIFFGTKPEEVQGGTLVYERNIVYPDREECENL